jgi:mannose-6-phosphate isomerase-like protein (cupin superfamily)
MKINSIEALQQLKMSGELFLELYQHGTLSVEIYQPQHADLQKPHDRDEIYVVISGSGTFFCGGERASFVAGDFLFVPAFVEHRFEHFTEDFSTWVIFYGPKGGEVPRIA